jgi:hypothetical protein
MPLIGLPTDDDSTRFIRADYTNPVGDGIDAVLFNNTPSNDDNSEETMEIRFQNGVALDDACERALMVLNDTDNTPSGMDGVDAVRFLTDVMGVEMTVLVELLDEDADADAHVGVLTEQEGPTFSFERTEYELQRTFEENPHSSEGHELAADELAATVADAVAGFLDEAGDGGAWDIGDFRVD